MMKHPIRATFNLALLLSASLALLAGVSQARAAQDGKPLYYASVKADGVVVRNLMDAKGLPLTELHGGDIVAVYEAPDDAVSARFTLQVAQLGSLRTQTLKAFPESAYREIIASLG